MKMIEEHNKDTLVGRLYENRVAHEKCYTFKIFNGKPVKENMIAMSYVYYAKQDKAKEDMFARLNETLAIIKDMHNFVL